MSVARRETLYDINAVLGANSLLAKCYMAMGICGLFGSYLYGMGLTAIGYCVFLIAAVWTALRLKENDPITTLNADLTLFFSLGLMHLFSGEYISGLVLVVTPFLYWTVINRLGEGGALSLSTLFLITVLIAIAIDGCINIIDTISYAPFTDVGYRVALVTASIWAAFNLCAVATPKQILAENSYRSIVVEDIV